MNPPAETPPLSADWSPVPPEEMRFLWSDLLRAAGETRSTVVSPEEVRQYLIRYSDVAPIAVELLQAARNVFGPDAEIALELYRDAEIDDEYLRVLVRLRQYREDFLQRLQSISDAHDAKLSKLSGYISVTTDYQASAPHGTV